MKKISVAVVFLYAVFLAFAAPCWAGGGKDKNKETAKQETPQTQTQPVAQTPVSQTQAYWTGDGGKGISLAVLEPTGKGLAQNEQWMLSLIQSSITGDFNKYSAMTIIDR